MNSETVWRRVGRWYLGITPEGTIELHSDYRNGYVNYGHTLTNGQNLNSYTTPVYLQKAVAAAWKEIGR